MRRNAFVALLTTCVASPLLAQTHVVKKSEPVVRAITVYEWTGEEGKASASRVVPVSIFINNQFEDAGIYLARPIPFALDNGTLFEAQKSGVAEGTVELAFARHVTSAGAAEVDNGWLGYGQFKLKPKGAVVAQAKSGPLPKVEVSGGTGPRFGSKPAAAGQPASKTDDASRPDQDRADQDRPTFHKQPDRSGAAGSGTTVSATGGDTQSGDVDSDTARDNPERPTLKKRTPAETKAAQKKNDQAKVLGGTALNDDPDRPNLHRGKPVSRMEEEDLPPLRGLPKDMHQLVAVSDVKDRPEHSFNRPWESDAERLEILGKMRSFAGQELSKATPAAGMRIVHATSAVSQRKAVPNQSVPLLRLQNEGLAGYTLSYGGAPTYVYTAETPAPGGATRYVTVVAQQDAMNGLRVALSSATDSQHLDRTPWMRPVDVVDAEASNRASLLFELRAQHTRQFALYRVLGAQAEQIFATSNAE